ncbi:3'-5' exonuclease [Denitromonas ohlonensis]|uniref:3'-5' exonuclease n=2 Tax=Denitromonas TaxID=139331 RepID=A0A557SQA5_9RHOO|nr:3'-5' exonuclease [Denitromonas ohlonensis]TVO65993.1 3'-5' exonuclease [Denitromonas ohlonensis]TVO79586.1 3'-5' exonuclease [Denitromonas ohlonensis]
MTWLSRLIPGAHPPVQLAPEIRARLDAWRKLPETALTAQHTETRYVIVNTEASGLDLSKDRLLSVAAIAIEGGLIDPKLAFYQSLEPDPADALTGLLEFIGSSPIVVFNAGFNKRVILNAIERVLDVEPELHCIDLYWLLPALFAERGQSASKLTEWMNALRIETFQRHHALGDGYAIAQLFLATQARGRLLGHSTPQALIELEHARQRLKRPL